MLNSSLLSYISNYFKENKTEDYSSKLLEMQSFFQESNEWIKLYKNRIISNYLDYYSKDVVKDFIIHNNQLYNYSIIILDSIINKSHKLIEELKVDQNALQLYLLYQSFINSGVFSVNELFTKTEDLTKTIDIYEYYGLSIIHGYGCCRHIADFLMRLIKSYDIQCDKLSVASSKEVTISDHCVIMSEIDKLPIIFDTTQIDVMRLCNKKNLIITGTTKETFEIRLFNTFVRRIQDTDNHKEQYKELKILLKFIKSLDCEVHYQEYKKFYELFTQLDDLLNDNKSLIDDYKKDIHYEKQQIDTHLSVMYDKYRLAVVLNK